MSSYKQLYLWVEGDDDERFFKKVIIPKFQEKYDNIKIIKYATMRKEKKDNFIKSIRAINADYIYFADINDSPCITAKKDIINKQHNLIDINNVLIVIKEIESWYLAGLNNDSCRQLKIKFRNNTDNVTKETFNNLIPMKYTSRIDFMVEILKRFSITEAIRKNKSFNYFIKKYNI